MTKAMKRVSAAVMFGLLLTTGLFAHPNHKVMGTITMVAADHVMVKTRDGKVHTIKLAKTTKVTKSKKPMKAVDIQVGARVVATTISHADLTAKTIAVGAAPAAK